MIIILNREGERCTLHEGVPLFSTHQQIHLARREQVFEVLIFGEVKVVHTDYTISFKNNMHRYMHIGKCVCMCICIYIWLYM
jgi:hypothetical protein